MLLNLSGLSARGLRLKTADITFVEWFGNGDAFSGQLVPPPIWKEAQDYYLCVLLVRCCSLVILPSYSIHKSVLCHDSMTFRKGSSKTSIMSGPRQNWPYSVT